MICDVRHWAVEECDQLYVLSSKNTLCEATVGGSDKELWKTRGRSKLIYCHVWVNPDCLTEVGWCITTIALIPYK